MTPPPTSGSPRQPVRPADRPGGPRVRYLNIGKPPHRKKDRLYRSARPGLDPTRRGSHHDPRALPGCRRQRDRRRCGTSAGQGARLRDLRHRPPVPSNARVHQGAQQRTPRQSPARRPGDRPRTMRHGRGLSRLRPYSDAVRLIAAWHGITFTRCAAPEFPWPSLGRTIRDVTTRLARLQCSSHKGNAGPPGCREDGELHTHHAGDVPN
jgi:hypothetical protein